VIPSKNETPTQTIDWPAEAEKLLGDDTIYIFLDVDNQVSTGYQIYLTDNKSVPRVGADYMIKFTGKFGRINQQAYYRWT
jgi:hypothetical protein